MLGYTNVAFLITSNEYVRYVRYVNCNPKCNIDRLNAIFY